MKIIIAVFGIMLTFSASAQELSEDCDCTPDLEMQITAKVSPVQHDDRYDVIFDRATLPEGDGVIEMFIGVEKKMVLDGEGRPQKVCAILTKDFLLDIDEPVPTDEFGAPKILLDDEMTIVPIGDVFNLVDESRCEVF